ncbi:hypothetical protein [Nonomuraea sp. NPDC049709]|uniref:hypothetical protein n=1 Tax=Nonomuraea sp. NPDC049709 TaxID=3154736 RepID=UPI00341A6373
MNALIRIALVGAVIGLGESVLVVCVSERNVLLAFLAMVFVPFPVSMALCWWGKLPHWWLVSVLGPMIVIFYFLLTLAVGVDASLAGDLGIGEWGGRLILMGVGAGAFTFAGALVMPMHLALRLTTLGVVVALCTASWVGADVIRMAGVTWQMASKGVPVVAPDLPEHRLVFADLEEGAVADVLGLSYERRFDQGDLSVFVASVHEKTAREACESQSRLDGTRVGEGLPATCREVWGGSWVRTEVGSTSVLAVRGDALVEVHSAWATEAQLLAVLPTIRPVDAWDLAAAMRP